jgi:membrane protease YdiL (CAAX protease family)
VSKSDEAVRAPMYGSPGWGLAFAAVGWIAAQVGGLIAISLVVGLSGVDADNTDDLSLGWVALGQVGLWAGLLGAPVVYARVAKSDLVRSVGLRLARVDALIGVVAGLATQLLLVPLLYIPIFTLFDVSNEELEEPARGLTDRATDPVGVLLLVLIVGIGAPIIEEIFYRGLLQRSLEKLMGVWPGIIGSAVLFGLSHFQLLQLPALVMLGMILGYLTHRYGRLGPAIFTHIAFNMVTVVFLVAS